MERIILLGLVSCFLTFSANSVTAQPVSLSAVGLNRGVYFTANELLLNQPTESFQDCSKHQCFSVSESGGNPVVRVRTEANTIDYSAGKVFAFVDCYGRVFRFYDEGYYQILEMGSITIYAKAQKIVNKGATEMSTAYFFSESITGELLPLEREKLMQVYSNHPDFANYVDKYFYPNVSLTAFNVQNGTYEISRIFSDLVGNTLTALH